MAASLLPRPGRRWREHAAGGGDGRGAQEDRLSLVAQGPLEAIMRCLAGGRAGQQRCALDALANVRPLSWTLLPLLILLEEDGVHRDLPPPPGGVSSSSSMEENLESISQDDVVEGEYREDKHTHARQESSAPLIVPCNVKERRSASLQ